MQEGWFKQKIPVATIPGTQETDNFVLVHGHYDSWDVGVGDNATGDATLAGARARAVAEPRWPSPFGQARLVARPFDRPLCRLDLVHRPLRIDLDENCVAQINCDSPGCRWATSYHETRAFTESAALARQAIRTSCPGRTVKTKRPPQAGDYSFNNIGLPSFLMLSSTMPEALRKEKHYYDVSGCGANIAWHTENDTIEIADRDILLKDMRIYLLSALRVANAEILPFDWNATCEEFLVDHR